MSSSRMIAIAGGVAVALVVSGLFVLRPVPDRVVALLGGPTGVDRVGGIRLKYRPAPGVSEAELAQLRSDIRRDGDLLVLEFPRVGEEMLPDLKDVLVGGGLRMQAVVESNVASGLAHLDDDVKFDIDRWRDEDGGAVHQDSYVSSPSLAALERVIESAHLALPPHTEIVFERIEPAEQARDPEVRWRTYLVGTEVLIDGNDIDNATVSYDPNTGRPTVLLDFTRRGGDKFCGVTRDLVGHKLATILGGRMRSAPIINGRICGGRASIWMGGSDPRVQEKEAQVLAAVLNQGSVPRGGSLEEARYIAPGQAKLQEWLGRGLLGLVAGLAFAGFVLALLGFARPSSRVAPAPVAGKFPVGRLIVTLCGPLALLVGRHFILPACNDVELEHVTRGGDTTLVSVIALGVMPILSAFAVVELAALIVPRWRWRRHDRLGRVRLSQATAILALVFAFVQGYFVAIYLESLSRGGAEIVATPGMRFRLLTMITLATGTFLLGALAGMISVHGLGNGYGVMLASSWFVQTFGDLIDAPGDVFENTAPSWLDGPHLFGVAVVAVMAVISWRLLRWRVRGDDREPDLRLPTSTISPLSDAGGIVVLLGTLSALGLGQELFMAQLRMNQLVARLPIYLALVLAFVPLWAWLLARPSLVTSVALQASLSAPSRRSWVRATVLSAGALLTLAALGRIAHLAHATAAQIANPVMVLIATAVVLDIADDLRAQREKLVSVGALHQIQRANVIERLLAAANIRCQISASNVRALFNFFGPWAPAIVLVPEADAKRAQELVDGVTKEAQARLPRAELQL